MTENYNILLNKIDEFIRKYYKNQIIKGLLIGLSIIGFFYLTIFILEYFNHFSINTRTALFYSSIAFSAVVFVKMILLPLLGLFNIGKIISRKHASKIITSHFPDINDKLLNTIELNEINQSQSIYSNDLVIASIDKRIRELN